MFSPCGLVDCVRVHLASGFTAKRVYFLQNAMLLQVALTGPFPLAVR